ncbi:MAG: LptF/LptG family permease [Nitrospinota bacterium]
MKRLHRYIFGEIFTYFLLCLFLLTFVLLLNRMFQLTDLVLGRGGPLGLVGRLLLTLMPVLLLAALPAAVLIACILGFSRLSNDSESVAMTATGMSLYSQLVPAGLLGLMAAAASAALMLYGLPWTQRAGEAITSEIFKTRAAAFEIRAQVFNDGFDGLVLYVRSIEGAERRMRGILISDSRDPESTQVIFAEQGQLVSDPASQRLVLHLAQGTIHKFGAAETAGKPRPAAPEAPPGAPAPPGENPYQVLRFAAYDLNMDLTQTLQETRAFRTNLRAQPIGELQKQLGALRPGTVKHNAVLVELHKKFATPLACLILALLGSPLGVQNRRSGRHGGFALSLAVLLIYYLLATFSEGMGESGVLPPAAAAWGPNALLLGLAIWAVRRVVRRGAMDLFGIIGGAIEKLPLPRRAGARAA